MKNRLLFSILFASIILSLISSCKPSKQRDVRKLNWYEITTDARASNIRVLVPEEEFELWVELFQEDSDSSFSRLNLIVSVFGLTPDEIRDSLQLETNASIVSIKGKDLEMALQREWLFGPFDRLLPISKTFDTSADVFRYSDGVLTQGFAVPLQGSSRENKVFFAIPQNAASKAGALFVLEKMMEARPLVFNKDTTEIAEGDSVLVD